MFFLVFGVVSGDFSAGFCDLGLWWSRGRFCWYMRRDVAVGALVALKVGWVGKW